MEIILQHGQSWTFECRYKLNSWADGEGGVFGIPEVIPEVVAEEELEFEFNYYSDETYNTVRVKSLISSSITQFLFQTIERPVIDIGPKGPEPDSFNIGITMEKYGDSWLHLQQCELIGEDGGYQEIIVKDGCSTNQFLYQLQGGQHSESFLSKGCLKIGAFSAKAVSN